MMNSTFGGRGARSFGAREITRATATAMTTPTPRAMRRATRLIGMRSP